MVFVEFSILEYCFIQSQPLSAFSQHVQRFFCKLHVKMSYYESRQNYNAVVTRKNKYELTIDITANNALIIAIILSVVNHLRKRKNQLSA